MTSRQLSDPVSTTLPSYEIPLTIGHRILIFVVFLLLWLTLVGSFDTQEMLAGLMVALLVSVISRPHLAIFSAVRLTPAAPLYLIKYLGNFFVALIASNLDMARRVLSPSLPIRPGVVEVRTSLRSPLGRLLLANSITLTPGTLSVDIRGERILVHWVDCDPNVDTESATRTIAAAFERHISGFLQ